MKKSVILSLAALSVLASGITAAQASVDSKASVSIVKDTSVVAREGNASGGRRAHRP